MTAKPIVGKHYKLNDTGIETINGLSSWAEVAAARDMTVETVSRNEGTKDEPIYSITVLGPLSLYALDQYCLDPL